MAFDTASFGSADGSNVNQQVSAHYGARNVGNEEGVFSTSGYENEAAVNFDGDSIDLPIYLPEGSYVLDVRTEFATGAITTATVGGDNIATADGTKAAIVGPVGGELVIEGPTAGTVVVVYKHLAQA
jgi:hypothetical protein